MKFHFLRHIALTTVAVCLFTASNGHADDAEAFFRGKQIRLIIGNAAGADYDLGGRVLSRHMNRHIPGTPSIIVQNMPGAAGIVAANYIANVAPKDGTAFGSVSRNLPGQAVLRRDALKTDPRQFSWIGSSGTNVTVCYVRRASPVMSAQDLFTKEVVVGGIGAGSAQSLVPTALNRVLSTKFRVVEGYKGNADALIAMERGEIDGLCSGYSPLRTTQASLMKEDKIRILLKSNEETLPDGPMVPSIYSFAKDTKQKQLLNFIFSSDTFGRPYFGPPEIPRDRLAVLRKAFQAALADPELIAEAQKLQIDMTFRSSSELETFVSDLNATAPELISEILEILPSTN